MNASEFFKGLLFLEGSAERERSFDHGSEFRSSYGNGNGSASDRAFRSRYGNRQAMPAQQATPCCAGGCG